MASLDPALLADYNATRYVQDRSLACFAPFSNIYFNVLGQGAPCWLTFFEGTSYPQQSIREIWFSGRFEEIRKQIRANDLSSQCHVCERNIKNRVFMSPLARAYDIDLKLNDYPQIMEFELSNQCNLECQMCNGRLSSMIRKNRDGLPAQSSPYDSNFIEQLVEFLPHLKEARVNGGEPFLQKLCWELWEKIVEVNSNIEITVATNGTVWNSRVADILSRGKFRINLSLDGFSKATYESIRKNSNFERVIEHSHHFGAYCRENGRFFSILINPMRVNWRELPLIVEFCNKFGFHLWFNTIFRPFHLALWNLPSGDLEIVQRELAAHHFSSDPGRDAIISESNLLKYGNLVNVQIATWIKEQREREEQKRDHHYLKQSRKNSRDHLSTKLNAAVPDRSRLELSWKKIEAVQTKVEKNISPEDFFQLLEELPVEALLQDLEKRSADEMAERVYYSASYY